MNFALSPLVGGDVTRADWRNRAILFVLWLPLVGWLLSGHALWRDEVRALSFALSGSTMADMLRITHGEGHPALWYVILRAAHDVFATPKVLPAVGALIGVATMALLAFRAPFRTAVIGLILFSYFGAFEYVVVARNYCIAALTMFVLAALYPRVRNSLWFGLIGAVMCNTNVPSCFLAACFLLFRFVEMLTQGERPSKREVLIFAGNALLMAIGAFLAFRMVYPTFNTSALADHDAFAARDLVAGIFDRKSGFTHLGVGLLLTLACLGLIHRPAAFTAAVAGLIGMKLFFYLIYPSSYRHEILYICLLISLFWMTAEGAGGRWPQVRWMPVAQSVGGWAFLGLLVFQTSMLVVPIKLQIAGIPYSQSRALGSLLRRNPLRNAIVMADPDTMIEPLPYYVDNPLYLLRQQQFGNVAKFNDKRRVLTLDDVLGDAQRLHAKTGRPVVFLSYVALTPQTDVRVPTLYSDETVITPDAATRFLSLTRRLGRLGPSTMDESYDVYVYPR